MVARIGCVGGEGREWGRVGPGGACGGGSTAKEAAGGAIRSGEGEGGEWA